ncbi:MAG: hypothetical protein M1169_10090 [Firmicutes bacterium]|nr:hypothetical protein [Bacillota bacterium]
MLKSRNGIALLTVLLVAAIFMVLSSYYVYSSIWDSKGSQAYFNTGVTFYLCDAGLQYAAFLVKSNEGVYPFIKYAYITISDQTQTSSAGSALNLYTGQEFVLISNMAYSTVGTYGDWLGTVIGTFSIQQTNYCAGPPTCSSPTLTIESTGYLKQVPPCYDPTQPQTDYSIGCDGSGPLATWPVLAQQTAYETIQISSGNWKVNQWYEKYQ